MSCFNMYKSIGTVGGQIKLPGTSEGRSPTLLLLVLSIPQQVGSRTCCGNSPDAWRHSLGSHPLLQYSLVVWMCSYYLRSISLAKAQTNPRSKKEKTSPTKDKVGERTNHQDQSMWLVSLSPTKRIVRRFRADISIFITKKILEVWSGQVNKSSYQRFW